MVKVDLLTYNNFYNNIAKKAGGLNTNYSAFKQYGPFTIDFNPNDGVDTEIVLNIDEANNVDYLIVYTATATSAVPAGTILSRWFILEKKRLRGGQCSFKLHRDVIVDNITDIKTSTALVERATLLDNDPFIFNKEDSSYNQIKISEEELKDYTNTPWIVGYLANTLDTEPKTITYIPEGNQYYQSFTSWDDFEFKNYVNGAPGITPTNFNMATRFIIDFGVNNAAANPDIYDIFHCQSLYNNPLKSWESKTYPSKNWRYKYTPQVTSADKEAAGTAMAQFLYSKRIVDNNLFDGTIYDCLYHYGPSEYGLTIPDQSTVQRFTSYNNKIIKVGPSGSEKFYRLQYTTNYSTDSTDRNIYSTSNDWKKRILEAVDASLTSPIEALGIWFRTNTITNGIHFHIEYQTAQFTATEISPSNNYSLTIPGTRKKLQDAPYTMFAIPYNSVSFNDGLLGFGNTDEVGCRGIASAMATALGGTGTTYIYDLQLLPYCPIQNTDLIVNGKDFRPTNIGFSLDKDFSKITKTVSGVISTVGFVFWLERSSFSVSIGRSIDVGNVKLSNETDLYRICSPNYQGTFDFSAAKNRGVSGFDIDCTYRPYTPYIKIAPIWNQEGIYGGTNDDGRGCICGGDFSLPIVDNAWIDYQISNKNFLNIFDRQIKSMDTMRGYQKTEQIFGSIFGGISGTAGGAATGKLIGGPNGAIAGTVIGAVGNIAAGITDYAISEARYKENKSLTTDMFNYQIGNVQALPDSLAKVGCQTANFRYWPMLEYYSCTDEEKENLDYILKTQGMKVGKVGTLNSYFDTAQRFTYENNKQFIRGRIVKSNLSDDTHMLMAVNNQLSAGVYFDKGLM